MCDGAPNQQRLSRDLAALPLLLPDRARARRFLRAFWRTVAREWGGVDALRADKFLRLMRECVLAGWRLFSRDGWRDAGGLAEYVTVLEEGPMSVDDPKVPDAVRYHVVDVYVDELERVVDEGGDVPLEVVLAPLRRLGREALNKVVRAKVAEALGDERVRGWLGDDQNEEDEEWNGIED
jgi:ribosomal RNA-processing protein 1